MFDGVDGQPAVYPFVQFVRPIFRAIPLNFMNFITASHTFGRCARVVFMKAHLVSVVFLLAVSVHAYAQSTPAPSSPAHPQPAPAPEAVHDLKLKSTKHEDWTKLSINGLGLQPNPPLPGGIIDRPQFTRELVRLQWRRSDALGIYLRM